MLNGFLNVDLAIRNKLNSSWSKSKKTSRQRWDELENELDHQVNVRHEFIHNNSLILKPSKQYFELWKLFFSLKYLLYVKIVPKMSEKKNQFISDLPRVQLLRVSC